MQRFSLFAFTNEYGAPTVCGFTLVLLVGICAMIVVAGGAHDRAILPATAAATTQAEPIALTTSNTIVAIAVDSSEATGSSEGIAAHAVRQRARSSAFPPVQSSGFRILALIAVASGASRPHQ